MSVKRSIVRAVVGLCVLGLAVPLIGLPTVNASSPTVHVPSTIDPTGSTEVSGKLNAFFASIPDGTTVEFPQNASYWTEATLYFEDRHGLTFNGNGARFFMRTDGSGVPCPTWANCGNWPRNRFSWRFTGGSGITLRNMTIQGGHPNGGKDGTYLPEFEAQHGIDLAGTAGVIIDGVTITDVWGDFVQAAADPRFRGSAATPSGWVWTTDLTIRNSFMERNGRQGIALTAVDGAHIVDNHISNTRRATFDLEPNTASFGATNVTIERNYIGPGRLLFIANAGAAGTISNIHVLDNVLDRTMSIHVTPRDSALGIRRRGPFVVRGNVSRAETQSQSALMQFVETDGVTVENNVQKFKPYSWGAVQSAVEYWDSCAVTVGANDFAGAAMIEENSTPDYQCASAGTTTTTTTTTPTTTTTVATTTTVPTTTTAPPPANGLIVSATSTSTSTSKGSWTTSIRWRLTLDGKPVSGTVLKGSYEGDHKFGASGSLTCTTDGRGECTTSASLNNKSSSVSFTVASPAQASVVVSRP